MDKIKNFFSFTTLVNVTAFCWIIFSAHDQFFINILCIGAPTLYLIPLTNGWAGLSYIYYTMARYIFFLGQILGLILFGFSYNGYLQGYMFGYPAQKVLIVAYFSLVFIVYALLFRVYEIGTIRKVLLYEVPIFLSPVLFITIYSLFFVDWRQMLHDNSVNYMLFNYAALVCWSSFWVVFVAFSRIIVKKPA